MDKLSAIDLLIEKLDGKPEYKNVLAAVNKARTIVQNDFVPPYFDGRKQIVDHITHYAKTLDDPKHADFVTGFAAVLTLLGKKNEDNKSEPCGP